MMTLVLPYLLLCLKDHSQRNYVDLPSLSQGFMLLDPSNIVLTSLPKYLRLVSNEACICVSTASHIATSIKLIWAFSRGYLSHEPFNKGWVQITGRSGWGSASFRLLNILIILECYKLEQAPFPQWPRRDELIRHGHSLGLHGSVRLRIILRIDIPEQGFHFDKSKARAS